MISIEADKQVLEIKKKKAESVAKKDLIKLNEEWHDLRKKIMEARRELKAITGGK